MIALTIPADSVAFMERAGITVGAKQTCAHHTQCCNGHRGNDNSQIAHSIVERLTLCAEQAEELRRKYPEQCCREGRNADPECDHIRCNLPRFVWFASSQKPGRQRAHRDHQPDRD